MRSEDQLWDAFLAFIPQAPSAGSPGRALDIAMGQGRNAVFLASMGWQTTGIDISSAGVAAAKENARRAGVQIDAHTVGVEDFDLGTNRWDLIVLTYALVPGGVGAREFADRVIAALASSGLLVVESFGSELGSPTRRPVDIDPNELAGSYSALELLRSEDEKTIPEWTDIVSRVIRMAARKPA